MIFHFLLDIHRVWRKWSLRANRVDGSRHQQKVSGFKDHTNSQGFVGFRITPPTKGLWVDGSCNKQKVCGFTDQTTNVLPFVSSLYYTCLLYLKNLPPTILPWGTFTCPHPTNKYLVTGCSRRVNFYLTGTYVKKTLCNLFLEYPVVQITNPKASKARPWWRCDGTDEESI